MDATNQIISNVWKTAIFLLFFLFLARSVNAQVQNGWTPNDSVRLTKMLKGEMPIHIDDAFKGNWNSLLLVIRQKTIIGTGMILG